MTNNVALMNRLLVHLQMKVMLNQNLNLRYIFRCQPQKKFLYPMTGHVDYDKQRAVDRSHVSVR